MSEKTITYETAGGVETTAVEDLQYDSDPKLWRFEIETGESSEIVRIPRERVYEIRQGRTERSSSGRDQYGHP